MGGGGWEAEKLTCFDADLNLEIVCQISDGYLKAHSFCCCLCCCCCCDKQIGSEFDEVNSIF